MNPHPGFLEAVRQRPGLKADRLIYADWLEERGDPLGSLIRLQCHAASLPRGSPRRLALEAEAHELLLRHEAEWLGPLLGVVSNWEFRGGFLQSVTVDTEIFLARAEQWLPGLPLLGVHLRKARGHVAALAACPQLAHLNGLYLGDNELTDEDLRALLVSPHLGNLTELYLQSNRLTGQSMPDLATSPRLPRLCELNLSANRLDDKGLQVLAAAVQLKRLRSLHLMMACVRAAGLQALADSALLSRLHSLYLSCNLLPAGTLKTLTESPASGRLRCLAYDTNEAADADVQALAASRHARRLIHLSLENNRSLSNASLVALARSANLRRLRTLGFGGCPFDEGGLAALGRSRALPSLRYLHLAAPTQGGEPVGPALLGGRLIRQLHDLNLSWNAIGTTGLAALASHPVPLRLRRLHLPLRDVDAPAWETLLAKGALKRLTDLTISELPSAALSVLLPAGRVPQLRKLTLLGFSQQGAEFEQFLRSAIARRLHDLALAPNQEDQGAEIVQLLISLSPALQVQRLKLHWSLTPAQLRQLTAGPPWPQLTSLQVGSFRLGAEGPALLAAWPVLGRLLFFTLHNSSYQAIPGLEALADSPHAGPLLRIDILNGTAAEGARPRLRQRFGGRFSFGGRKWPRVTTVGGSFFDDDE